MFKRNWIFLGAAACFFFVGAEAQAKKVAVIQPEDEQLLEDIFTEQKTVANIKSSVKEGYEDGSGTVIKGVLPASKVSAEPLSAKILSGAEETNMVLSADKNGVITVEAGAGATLRGTEKAVVNAPVYKDETLQTVSSAGETKKNTPAQNIEISSSDAIIVGPRNLTENLPRYSGGAEEIIYMTPHAQDWIAARASLGEQFKPAQNEISQTGFVKNDGTERYRNRMADCFAQQQNNLEMDRAMFYRQNIADAAAYISQTFAEINGCYEDIGYDIISEYYGGDEELMQKFAGKVPEFYVTGTDEKFDTKFCNETCSMDAVFAAQIDRFAEFRTYLSQLLANRPKETLPNE